VPAKRLTIPNTNIGQFFYFTGLRVLKNYETGGGRNELIIKNEELRMNNKK